MRVLSSLSVRLVAIVSLSQLVATEPSPGCANATAQSDIEKDSTSRVKLEDRDYLLYIPTNYDPATPAPLILSYHGGSRDAEFQAALDQFNTSFFNVEYLVAYPNSVDGFWQGSPGETSDDIGFTRDILTDIGSAYCVDDARIYATGKSQGGGMAGVLAADAELSTMIAAFAPVAGAFYVSQDNTRCRPDTVAIPNDPGRPNIPILEFHGAADDVIPYAGGADRGDCLPAVTHWIQSWAQANGMDPDTNTTSLVPGAENNDSTVFQFGEGASLGMVTHILVGEDIGHDWPSTVDNADNLIKGHRRASFNASTVIMDFFARHRIVAATTTASSTGSGLGPAQNSVSSSGAVSGATPISTTTTSFAGTARRGIAHLGLMLVIPSLGMLYIGS